MAKICNSPEEIKRHEHHSVAVRQIDNGFIVRESHSDEDGYREKEHFRAERPKIAGLTQQHNDRAAGGQALRQAISHIRGKK